MSEETYVFVSDLNDSGLECSFDDGVKLTDAIAWLTAKLKEIPEQYRADAECRVGGCGCGTTMSVGYYRPETDAEAAERLANKAHAERVCREMALRRWAAIEAAHALRDANLAAKLNPTPDWASPDC